MTRHLLSDIPAYKKQQQAAKRLFREMQIEEVSHIIPLLPNRIIVHYRPVEEDIAIKMKNFLKSILKLLKKFRCFGSKRSVCVVKSQKIFQLHAWKHLREQLQQYLSGILAGKTESDNYIEKILRPIELNTFLCAEQAVQIAFLEAMRFFKEPQLHLLEQYAEHFETGSHSIIPSFLFEMKRALQWTFALREAWECVKQGTRHDPKAPLEDIAELVFR